MNSVLVLFFYFPVNAQNFWVSTEGPFGGAIQSLAINQNNHLFAGTNGSGVFRSTDNGHTWIQKSADGLRYSYITSLAINSSGYIYVGTDGDGVFRSTDNGEGWVQINESLWNNKIYCLLIDINGIVYAGTDGSGIYRVPTNSNTWTNNGNMRYCHALALNRLIDGAIFCGTRNEIYRSIDDGITWKLMNNFQPYWFGNFTTLTINEKDNIFAGHSYFTGVFRSIDNGNSWIQKSISGFSTSHVNALAINSVGYIFAGTDGEGVFYSTDNAETWVPINLGLTNKNITSIAINKDGYVFAGSVDGIVCRSRTTTTPLQSVLISPLNLSTDMSIQVPLLWHISPGAESYLVQISDDPTFSKILYSRNEINDTLLVVTDLSSNTTYYWRVKAYSESTESEWSDVWSFSTGSSVLLSTKIYLSGAYNQNIGQMSVNLKNLKYLSATSPYAASPRSISGIRGAITDWVLVELRKTSNGIPITSKSVLLRNDGYLVDDDGMTTSISLNAPTDVYYIVVRHRNHLAVMTATTIALSSNVIAHYDFSTGMDKYYGNDAKLINNQSPAIYGAYGGDANGNGVVNATDENAFRRPDNGKLGYYGADQNLDGVVNATDENGVWRISNGRETRVPN